MVDLGTRLKDLRKARGLTQLQVAERVGISKAMVSSYELSVRQPSYDVLIKLAALFGVTTDHLLGLERERFVSVKGLSEEHVQLILSMIAALQNAN